MTTLFDFTAPLLNGTPQKLSAYAGKVVLIVNVASHCGFTRQYTGLEALWRAHKDAGLVILGFPCNQFGEQEAGTAEEIAEFCSLTYEVTFPIFAKIEVNGPGTDPIYAFLKSEARGILWSEAVKWNFTKFLVGRDGQPVKRYGSDVEPEALEADIAALL
ncbi:glutathione peroxidase [Devosia sp.]|uniref:glutathione peroxidase n=1 Tax=Devosia sp. TaxID=1871048 RepID=UPI003264CAE1